MNGIHDMGGMHGLSPLEIEQNEPVFHAPWEGRVYALVRAMGATGKLTSSRYQIERIPAAEYLRMSYYEKWLTGLVERLAKSGLVSVAEIREGTPADGSFKATPALTAAQVPEFVARRAVVGADGPAPRFQVGHRARARNINPLGHTRLPRYARGKTGLVERDFGIFNLQDTGEDGRSLGANPQHVYSVRFTARELWGDQASPRDSVYIDLWDDYLEPV